MSAHFNFPPLLLLLENPSPPNSGACKEGLRVKRRGRALGSLERRKGGRKGENGSFVCTTEQQRGNEEEEEEDGGEEEGAPPRRLGFA